MARLTDNPREDSSPVPSALYDGISQRTARVGVVGLGYVGLPMMLAATEAGFRVTGIDIDSVRVGMINSGRSYLHEIEDGVLSRLVAQERITATADFGALDDMDVVLVCVPTPVNEDREPQLGPLQDAVQALSEHMHREQLVILQSTSFPGTTEELVLPSLQKAGHRVGKEFYLAFSPERIDPGNRKYFIHNTPKVVGGVTPQCGRMATAFLSTFVEQVVPVTSPKVAEMTKLLENTFRSVNIALVTELSELCQRMDIDFWDVIHAARTKPFGFMPFYPGIGVGGHCTPVDPSYLAWKAREYDFDVKFIDLAATTNDNRPYYVASRIGEILADRGKELRDSSLLLLGVSFKKDVEDTRNSPALQVAAILAERGASVAYSDRHVPKVTIGGCTMESQELDEETLKRHDVVVLLVDHCYYDVEMIVRNSKLVIDTQDATRPQGPAPNVVKL